MNTKTVTMERLSGKIGRALTRNARGRRHRRLERQFERAEAAAKNKRQGAAGWWPEPRYMRNSRAGALDLLDGRR